MNDISVYLLRAMSYELRAASLKRLAGSCVVHVDLFIPGLQVFLIRLLLSNFTRVYVIMKVFISAILFMLLVESCAVTEKNMSGIYRLNPPSRTMLVLYEDHRFEFVKNFAQPGPALFPDSNDLNFRTAGSWQQNKQGQLILNSFPDNKHGNDNPGSKDSITPYTDISSFSFWDQYGDPLPIRLIRFPANRSKLHKSNIVSFFAEDFAVNDTLEFHFYGYRPYRWIITPAERMTNQQHRVTIYEPFRAGYFHNRILIAGRNKIADPGKSFALYRAAKH